MRALLYLLTLILALSLSASSIEPPNTLKLCHDSAQVHPWVINRDEGLNLYMLRLLGRRLGLRIETTPLPWAQCLNSLGSGEMNGAFAASFAPSRLSRGVFPGGAKLDEGKYMMIDGYTLFRLSGGTRPSLQTGKLKALGGPIAAQTGYAVVEMLRRQGYEVDDSSTEALSNLRKLISGQAQLAALRTSEGDYLINKPEFLGKIEKIEPPLIEKPYFLMLSKQFVARNSRFAAQVWAGLAAVRESSEYQKALAQYRNYSDNPNK